MAFPSRAAPPGLTKLSEASDVAELRRRWHAAKSIIHPIPPFEELMLGSVGRIGENMLLLGQETGEWRVLSAGPKATRRIEGGVRGVAIADLEPDFSEAFSDASRQAIKNRAPYLTERYFARDGFAQCFDILALPLANRWGGPFVAIYVGERGPRYSLVDAIFRSTDDGVIAFAVIRDQTGEPIDFQVVDLNQGAARLLGESVESLRWRRLSAGRNALSSEEVVRRLYRLLECGRQEKFEIASSLGGEATHFRVSLNSMGDLICASMTDVTALRLREQSYRLLFNSNPMPMWIVDAEAERFLAVNDAAVEHYGIERERFLSMPVEKVCLDSERGAFCQSLRASGESGEPPRNWRHVRSDGGIIEVLCFGRRIEHHGRPSRLVAIVDITQRKMVEAEVAYLAHHDALTGLRNRAFFLDKLEASLERGKSAGSVMGVCFVDLDLFKEVNDSFGHPTGDRLLQMVAQRLQHGLREGDLAARLGGDEFAILLNGIEGPGAACETAARVVEAVSRPYNIEGQDIAIRASIGVALFPDDGATADELVKNADTALYRAKSEGGGSHRLFHREMDVNAQRRRSLEAEVKHALQAGQFEIFYQPVVDLPSGQVGGAEALLRWRHPERGLVSPAEFIPIAEATGLIAPLGEWVLKTACAEAVKWPAHITIAINLSPIQFRSPNLVNAVVSALALSGLNPARLELEITESALLGENEATLATLHKLRAFGIRIAMDDFGTGYSSLSYLRSFPFDKIKIDRSFVKDLAERDDCTAIVCAISSLARTLGIATTAEGVESQAQLEFLQAQGCDQAQGFLFGPAVPAANLADIIGRINGAKSQAA